MSALVGVYRFDGKTASEGDVQRMLASMPHRSPDGQGFWAGGPVGLGHGMMHTTPESLAEVQPVASRDGRYVLAAYARLDNRDDLLPLLDLERTASDSEVLVQAYARWGRACLDRLLGDFTFAVWDTRAQELLIARDHLGAYPLYYAHRPGTLLAFATEPKALFALPEVSRTLNELRIADYLSGIREDEQSTIYEEVLRLPAGHHISVSEGHVRLERYYTLEPATDVGARTDEEFVARFRALFAGAVRARLRSAFPVGSQLSGGLDSSAVTCMARELASQEGLPIHTFSLVFPETTSSDEQPYIDAVLEGGGLTPHYVDGDQVGPLGNVREVYQGLDDHLVGGTQHLVWALLKSSRDAGVRVVLDGIDGDTVVDHGELRLRELTEAGQWKEFAYEARAVTRRFEAATHRQDFEHRLSSVWSLIQQHALPVVQAHAESGRLLAFARAVEELRRAFGIPRRYFLKRYGRKLLVPPPLRRWRRARIQRRRPSDPASGLPNLVAPEFARRVGLAERLEHFQGAFPYDALSVRGLQLQLLGGGRLASVFETTNHYAAMLGLDIRHPFMDRRLLEFCLALPSEQSLMDGWPRRILRQALADVLPPRIAWRAGKADMSPSAERGLEGQDRALLEDALCDMGRLAPYVDGGYVQRALRERERLSGEELTRLTQVAILSLWLRDGFDGRRGRVSSPQVLEFDGEGIP